MNNISEIAVLTEFGVDTQEVNLIKNGQQKHPHLLDIALRDLINGIEVVDDHVRVAKSRNKLLNRLFDSVTGTAKDRQDIINQNLSKGLQATSQWLQKHEHDFFQLRISHFKTLDHVDKNRKAIRILQQKFHHQQQDIEMIYNALSDIQGTIRGAHQRIDELDYRDKAQSHLQREIDHWESGRDLYNGELIQLYNLLDNLRNGEFGFYLNYGKANASEKEKLKTSLLDKTHILLRKRLNIDSATTLSSMHIWGMDQLKAEFKNLAEIEQETINYLSNWCNTDTPMTRMVNQLSSSERVSYQRTIVVIPRAAERMVAEHFPNSRS